MRSVTLSILTEVSQLFLETNRQEQVRLILVLVLHHPASNQAVKERVQRQIDPQALDLDGGDERIALEALVDEALRYLRQAQ